MNVLIRFTRYLSKKSNSEHTTDHAFEANPEAEPGKQIEFNFFKNFGKKSIELPKLDAQFAKVFYVSKFNCLNKHAF